MNDQVRVNRNEEEKKEGRRKKEGRKEEERKKEEERYTLDWSKAIEIV